MSMANDIMRHSERTQAQQLLGTSQLPVQQDNNFGVTDPIMSDALPATINFAPVQNPVLRKSRKFHSPSFVLSYVSKCNGG